MLVRNLNERKGHKTRIKDGKWAERIAEIKSLVT
jgi:hypothetical protein